MEELLLGNVYLIPRVDPQATRLYLKKEKAASIKIEPGTGYSAVALPDDPQAGSPPAPPAVAERNGPPPPPVTKRAVYLN